LQLFQSINKFNQARTKVAMQMTQKTDFESYFHEDQNKLFSAKNAPMSDDDEEQMSDGE